MRREGFGARFERKFNGWCQSYCVRRTLAATNKATYGRRRLWSNKLIVQVAFLSSLGCALPLYGKVFEITTPGGIVTVDIPHVDKSGSLVKPLSSQSTDFRPPSIFSAPLPRGSGARALGVAELLPPSRTMPRRHRGIRRD